MLTTQMTMYEAFRQMAEKRPEQEALICEAIRLTYTQMLQRVEALAAGLLKIGFHKGDCVVCTLPAGPDFATLFFAVAKVGGVFAPLNPQIRQRRLIEVLKEAQPSILITERPIDEESIQRAARMVRVIFAKPIAPSPLGLEQLIADGQSITLPPIAVSPSDLLALLYTSGTTGTPKATMHSHKSLIAPVVASLKLRELWMRRPGLAMFKQTAVALRRYRMRLLKAAGRPQTMLSTVGWHTITGLEVMLQALLMGDRLVVMPRFHPREALETVEREKVTILIAVPLAYQMMLRVEGFEKYDLSSLLICATGAAPCPPELAREIQQRFGGAVHIGFGATETAGGIAATSLADSGERQIKTVGRPMPGIEVKIVDEQGRELPFGQVGELLCRGENIMLGYYRAPEMTAEVINSEGWYHTGDLAMMDAEGYIHIVGRKKDVIIRGGQNIYPTEIESYLESHPKIREAAVVGVPSPLGDESVWAFIRLEEGANMTPEEVLDYCRRELEPYQIPSQVRFVEEFPRSEVGKPQKFKLRMEAIREMEGGKADEQEAHLV